MVHDYTPVNQMLGLPSLTDQRLSTKRLFLSTLLSNSLDFQSILKEVSFRVPTRSTRNTVYFRILLYSVLIKLYINTIQVSIVPICSTYQLLFINKNYSILEFIPTCTSKIVTK